MEPHEESAIKLQKNGFEVIKSVLNSEDNKKINFYEIDRLLSKNNFILYNLENFSYNEDNRLAWFDLLYKKHY